MPSPLPPAPGNPQDPSRPPPPPPGGYGDAPVTGIDPFYAANGYIDGGYSDPGGRMSQQDPYWSNYFRNGQASAGARADVGPSATNQANQAGSRSAQDALIQQMQGIAQGGDSPAMRAQKEAFDNARGQSMSLAANQRNVGAGAALRQGRAQQDQLTTQQAPQAALLQAQQQQAAQQALMALYQQQRQQDLALADMQGQGRLRNQGMNDALQQGMVQGGLGYETGGWQQNLNQAQASLGFGLDQAALNQQFMNQLMQSGGAAVSTAAGMNWGGGGGGAPSAPPMVSSTGTPYDTNWSNPYPGG